MFDGSRHPSCIPNPSFLPYAAVQYPSDSYNVICVALLKVEMSNRHNFFPLFSKRIN